MLDADVKQLLEDANVATELRQIGIQFKDEGSNLGDSVTVNAIDFTGAGVTASRLTNTLTVNIPGGSTGYTHTQGASAAEWIVNHNFGYKPNVEVRTVGNVVMDAEVLHNTDNQVRIYFAAALTGSARCV